MNLLLLAHHNSGDITAGHFIIAIILVIIISLSPKGGPDQPL